MVKDWGRRKGLLEEVQNLIAGGAPDPRGVLARQAHKRDCDL